MKKWLLSLLMFGFAAKAEFVVPPTPYPVNDYAKVLSLGDKELIAKKLVTLRTETGVQLGVLIVDTLDGTAIEEASIKVVESWKLGSKGTDDGVLLMLAIKDRKSRIEVGKGLEGFLTDSNTKEILYEMRSLLKSGNYYGALSGAVDTITYDVKKNKDDIMKKPVTASTDSNYVYYFVFGILGLVCLVSIIIYLNEEKKRRLAEEEAARQRLLNTNSGEKFQTFLANRAYGAGNRIPTRAAKPTTSSHKSPTVIAPVYIDNSSHYESSSSSSSSSSDYSSSSSDFSGGGGSFGGGGSSDSW